MPNIHADALSPFNALPDGTFHWTPDWRKQLPPAIHRELRDQYPIPPVDLAWAPSPFGDLSTKALGLLNPSCRSVIEKSGVLTATSIEQLPHDIPSWQRMVVGLLDTEDDKALIHQQHCADWSMERDRLVEWLLRSAWHCIGPAATMKLLRELIEAPPMTSVGRVAWASFVHAKRLEAAWHWLAALDDTTYASVDDAVQWLQRCQGIGSESWFGWFFLRRARTVAHQVNADKMLLTQTDSVGQASALFLIEHAGEEAFAGLRTRLARQVSSFSGLGNEPETFRKDAQGKVKKIMKLWMEFHHQRLVDCVLHYHGDPLMLTYLAELVNRWPRLVLTRILSLNPTEDSPLISLVENTLLNHRDWVDPLVEACEALEAGVKIGALRPLQAVISNLPTVPNSSVAITSVDTSPGGITPVAQPLGEQKIDIPPDLPELLRHPPWSSVKKPTAKEKAEQPWLKLPSRLPQLPPFLAPSRLTPPVLKSSGQALNLSALGSLLTMFMLSKPGAPYAGLAQVLPAFEQRSLAELGEQLQGQWEEASCPTEERWMLLVHAWTGDEQTVDSLVDKISDWPSEMAFPRAKFGLSVLADMAMFQGNDEPLQALIRFAEKGKPSLRKPAQQQIQRAAQTMGLTPEQLGDRLISDLGLSRPQDMVFDYGARRFMLHVDDTLQVVLNDEDGKRLKDIPKPNSQDLLHQAENEAKRWKELKKAARTLVSEQLNRLESALISQRLWSAAEFTRLFQHHPLLREIGRRLLWCTDEATPRHFRVAEDYTTLDLHDKPIAWTEGLSVRLAHPIHLDANELTDWTQVWADYELLQPFEQLARRVYRLLPDGPDERADITVVHEQPVAAGSLLGLIQQGWTKIQDGVDIFGLEREFANGGTATLMLHESLNAASPLNTPVLRIRSLALAPALSPLACSEVLRVVDRLARA